MVVCVVHYSAFKEGWTEYDSSYKADKPCKFTLGQGNGRAFIIVHHSLWPPRQHDLIELPAYQVKSLRDGSWAFLQ